MMQPWFTDAKLGIFIHWGIYAVNGIAESWSFFNGEISYEDYFKQKDGFTGEKYNPNEWAKLFKEAGAKYAVLTAKHHDGFALWNTKESDLNCVKSSPAGRDLVAPYCDAIRAEGIQVGLYFSQLDWSHPGYAPQVPVNKRTQETVCSPAHPYKFGDDPQWKEFLRFHRAQLKELCTEFGKIDLLWFDGDWWPSPEQWKMKELRDLLHSWQPEVILNSRMHGHGDYETPEQAFPIIAPEGQWEFCMTINDSWGYQPRDKNYKTPRQIIRTFVECIGMGGNLLLDIGPKPDGTIPEEQVAVLKELGGWIKNHSEAVYGTVAGLPAGHFYGATTLSKDRTVIYAYLFDRPWDAVAIKGINNRIKRISALKSGRELDYKMIGGAPWMKIPIPGVLWINIPESEIDKYATVIKIELEGELDLYRGQGKAITVN